MFNKLHSWIKTKRKHLTVITVLIMGTTYFYGTSKSGRQFLVNPLTPGDTVWVTNSNYKFKCDSLSKVIKLWNATNRDEFIDTSKIKFNNMKDSTDGIEKSTDSTKVVWYSQRFYYVIALKDMDYVGKFKPEISRNFIIGDIRHNGRSPSLAVVDYSTSTYKVHMVKGDSLDPGGALKLYWTGGTVGHTQDWSTATNWGLTSGGTNGSVPTSSDSTFFDNNSTVQCTLTTTSAAAYLNFQANYTRGFKQPAFDTLSITNVFIDSCGSTVTVTMLGVLNFKGDGIFALGAATKSIVPSLSSDLTTKWFFHGNDTLYIRKAPLATLGVSATSGIISELHVADSGKVVVRRGQASPWYVRTLYIHGGTLQLDTLNLTPGYADTIHQITNPITISGGSTITGVGTGVVGSLQMNVQANKSYTINIPALTMTGNTKFAIAAAGSNFLSSHLTYAMQGNMNVPAFNLLSTRNNDSLTFNTNGYSLTTTTGDFQIDCAVFAVTKIAAYFGTSLLDVAMLDTSILVSGQTDTGTVYLQMQSSQWKIRGNTFIHKNQVYTKGTSIWKFENNANVTTLGTAFHSIIIDTGKTTFLDTLTCDSLVLRSVAQVCSTKASYFVCTTPGCSLYIKANAQMKWDSLYINPASNNSLILTPLSGSWGLNTKGSRISYSKWIKFNACNATLGNTVKCLACDDLSPYSSTGIKWYEKPVVDGVNRSMYNRDGHTRYQEQ